MNKPPIVLIHGFRGSPQGLEDIGFELKMAGYEVHIPPIMPFAGARTNGRYTPRAYADSIAEYIARERLDRPVLIGHSMGSTVVAATVRQHPGLLHRKVVLMSPISKRPARLIGALAPLSAYLPRKMVDYVTTKYLIVPKGKGEFLGTLEKVNFCSDDQPPLAQDVMGAARFALNNAVIDFDLQDFRKDILLIAGSNDKLVSQNATRKLGRKLGVTPVFLENTGHLHNYEQPYETAKALIRFLEDEK